MVRNVFGFSETSQAYPNAIAGWNRKRYNPAGIQIKVIEVRDDAIYIKVEIYKNVIAPP